MKKFRFKYSVIVWVLILVVILLAAAGLCWNIFNLSNYSSTYGTSGDGIIKIVLYSLIVLLNAVLVFLAISIAAFANYEIKDGKLYSHFGIICSKYPVSEITSITHFKKSDKLVAYFSNGKYVCIVISPLLYDDFIKALREENPSILFDAKYEDEL